MTKHELFWPRFRAALDESHDWPSEYLFKFISPAEKVALIDQWFPKELIRSKPSKKGNYYSLSIKMPVDSSETVVKIYQEIEKIEGVISL